MIDDQSTDASPTTSRRDDGTTDASAPKSPRKRTTKKTTKALESSGTKASSIDAPVTKSAVKKTAAKKTAPKSTTKPATKPAPPAAKSAKSAKAAKSAKSTGAAVPADPGSESTATSADPTATKKSRRSPRVVTFSAPTTDTDAAGTPAAPSAPLLFQAPDAEAVVSRSRRKPRPVDTDAAVGADSKDSAAADVARTETDGGAEAETDGEGGSGRRRRRGGRGRKRRPDTAEGGDATEATSVPAESDAEASGADDDESGEGEPGSTRRRRRRRRGGASEDSLLPDDPPNTVVRVRAPRKKSDPTVIKGSTRLEAKKQRRREGREAGRRRPSILTESEFLARRESVDRVMVVRELDGRIQIAVLEDGVLVEHYVNRTGGSSMVGSVYLGKVQNVLPSMEAAFVDVGRGRNAVLYAGEVNWDAAGLEGQAKRIELALKSGDDILVQVTKDPVGHKGARLTSQISLPGRFLVYVPGGSMTGISRKLPEGERNRLKSLLRRLIPDDGGVIVRTAAEGASEEELVDDVGRLVAQWEQIQEAAEAASKSAPALLHGEPDLAIKIVRDIFNEDFNKLIVSGAGVWDTVEEYVTSVAPDLVDRLEKWVGPKDLFKDYRIDEQLAKGLDRKVWLPSGGSLVIDRTEAMTVVDVNTGKFTGQGGNLEETVTRNNIEAAEEMVRQLRLRDIGGIIVIDFIDMVLESNRDAVLRRLVECLGRDRTKHQVAEVTSLGLVQMTRKRLGQGLLEVFSEPCDCCNGRGIKILAEPTDAKGRDLDEEPAVRRTRRSKTPAPEITLVETPPAVLAAIESIAVAASHSHHADEPVAAEREEDQVAASTPEPIESELGQPESSQPESGQSRETQTIDSAPTAPSPRPRRRRAASRPAGPATAGSGNPV